MYVSTSWVQIHSWVHLSVVPSHVQVGRILSSCPAHHACHLDSSGPLDHDL